MTKLKDKINKVNRVLAKPKYAFGLASAGCALWTITSFFESPQSGAISLFLSIPAIPALAIGILTMAESGSSVSGTDNNDPDGP
jgi:hypothetical protein